jgi:DNA-binding transcriptional MerR regulator
MASKISGVGVHTIRAWEKRYKALVPNRDSAGHRTYTKADIEKLMLLSELCLLGYTISKVAKLNIPELKEQLKNLGKTEEEIESHEFNLIKEKPSVDSSQSVGILRFALRSYKLDVIHQEVGKLKHSLGAREMAIDVLMPLYSEMRELIARGELSSLQEQTITTILRFHAGSALYKIHERRERGSINIAVAGLEGETSDLGSIIAGLLCNHYGFNYSFLGSGLSIDVLAESLAFLDTNFLVLNATTAVQQFGQSHVQTYIEKLLNKSNRPLEILLSGKVEIESHGKRLNVVKTFEALDEFLSHKNS